MRQQTIDAAIGLLGMFAQRSKGAAKALIAVNTALRVSEIIQDTARAQTLAMATLGPILGRPAAAKMGAFGAAQVGIALAAGAMQMGGVGRGSAGGARAAGGASSRTAAASRTADAPVDSRQTAPQRILIQGLDPNAMFSGEQLQNLFEAFYNENDSRGKVFVVSQ